MIKRRPERFIALVSVFLLLALCAGTLNFHSHPEGRGKTCTLCQAPHVCGSLATVAGLSGPLASRETTVPHESRTATDNFISSASSRGPPVASPVV